MLNPENFSSFETLHLLYHESPWKILKKDYDENQRRNLDLFEVSSEIVLIQDWSPWDYAMDRAQRKI